MIEKRACRRIILEILFCSANVGGVSVLALMFAGRYGLEGHKKMKAFARLG